MSMLRQEHWSTLSISVICCVYHLYRMEIDGKVLYQVFVHLLRKYLSQRLQQQWATHMNTGWLSSLNHIRYGLTSNRVINHGRGELHIFDHCRHWIQAQRGVTILHLHHRCQTDHSDRPCWCHVSVVLDLAFPMTTRSLQWSNNQWPCCCILLLTIDLINIRE